MIPSAPTIPPEYLEYSHAIHDEKKTTIEPMIPNTSPVFDIAARVLSAAVNFFVSMCGFICYSNKDSGNIFVMPIENCILAQNKSNMDQEQEIKNLRRKLSELSRDYYQYRVAVFNKSIAVAIAVLLGLIVGYLL